MLTHAAKTCKHFQKGILIVDKLFIVAILLTFAPEKPNHNFHIFVIGCQMDVLMIERRKSGTNVVQLDGKFLRFE
jgi:hypothetical protein